MVAVGLGSRFLELRGKKQMETILNPNTGQVQEVETSILVAPTNRDPLDAFLDRSQLQGGIQTLLQQAGLQWSPSHLVIAMAVGALVGGVLGLELHPLGFGLSSMFAFAFVLGGLPLFFVRHKRSSRLKEMEEQLPEALDFLARSMRAGHAFSISLEMIGAEMPDPLGQEFRALFAEHNLGAPLETAMANFGKRVPLLDVRLFISSVALQRQTGGNLSEVSDAAGVPDSRALPPARPSEGGQRPRTSHQYGADDPAAGHDICPEFRGAGLSFDHGQRSRWEVHDRCCRDLPDTGLPHHAENRKY